MEQWSIAFTGNSNWRCHPGLDPRSDQVRLILRRFQVYLKPAREADSMSSIVESKVYSLYFSFDNLSLPFFFFPFLK